MGIFYLPKDGVCGDFIPYYNPQRGLYELYYLHDYRGQDGQREGTDWRRITTKDMLHFEEEGVIIPRTDAEGQDMFCYTGCVVIHENVQHIFYTGHNYHFKVDGKRQEAIMHATSMDGVHWTKHEDLSFFAPDGLDIEQHDWRDPFVFYHEEEKCWWMLLCTRKKTGPDRLRGATGLLKSEDLNHWEYCGSFWSPSCCWCPECPDLFRFGKYWYLVYSTFSEAEGFGTYYRMAESLEGPWKAPAYNTFDARAFYAGKTASDGEHRYIFGWNPTKTGDTDFGVWQWGGNLVVHELWQEENGELRVKMPEGVRAAFTEDRMVRFCPMLQESETKEDTLCVRAESGFGAAMSVEELPASCMLEAEIRLSEGTHGAGFVLHADEAGDEGYYLRLEAAHGKLEFERVHRIFENVELERSANIEPEVWHKLTVLLDGTAMTAYLDGEVALSARMYDYRGGRVMAFVCDGTAEFRNVRVYE